MKAFYKFLFIFLLLTICSCQKENVEPRDQRLLYFRSSFKAELGDREYDKYYSRIAEPKIKYLDDIIIVTKYIEANACDQSQGNIKVANNTIMLQYNSVSDEVCTSRAVEKLTYIIDNPTSKKYKFKFE